MNSFSFQNGGCLPQNKTLLMGILNFTPDSFSDGGRYFTVNKAVSRALALEAEGADIIDVGACSTRPNTAPVSKELEWERLSQLLPDLLRELTVPVSVDTFYPENAKRCLSAGVRVINDVSGIFSKETANAVKQNGAGYIVTHGGVKSGLTEANDTYPMGVLRHTQMFFDEAVSRLTECGLKTGQLCLDPGFGFSKTVAQNLELIRGFSLLNTHGCTLMAALSKKRFIGFLSGQQDIEDRAQATLAAGIYCAVNGANILRVHDVALHKNALFALDGIIR